MGFYLNKILLINVYFKQQFNSNKKTNTTKYKMDLEGESTFLGNLFQTIVTDMKGGSSILEDAINKSIKLHQCLKATCVSLNSFHESMQKVADTYTNSKGSTKEIGSALTRICVRQKLVHSQFKNFTSGLSDHFIVPISDKLDDWKRTAGFLEKEHTKETKKHVNEI